MLDSLTAQDLIKPYTPVVCAEDGQFATVDHVEGHHDIPLDWGVSVDDKVHVDRPGAQAMRDWIDEPTPPQAAGPP